MLAQPLSNTAARIAPLTGTLAPSIAGSSTPQAATLPPTSVTPQATDAGLAHDAGNLLAALRLYSDLLSAAGVLRPEHRHYAAEIRLLSDRSAQLVDRLLGQTTPPPPTGTHPIAQSLRQLAPLLSRIAAPHASVHVLAVPPIRCNHPSTEVIERIVLNLVGNAAEAIATQTRSQDTLHRTQGRIQVSLSQSATHLSLEVEDNGPGLPLTVAAAFLHPTLVPAGARHGHGHRIVHQLARDTGATLTLRVRRAHGTTFRFDWPLAITTLTPSSLEQPSTESSHAC